MPTQISWDRQIPCATGQNRSIKKQTRQLGHGRVKTKDQLGDQTQTHDDQRPCSWGTVPWRRGWYAYCSPCLECTQERQCDALWYTVFVLLLAHSKNLTLKRCYMKNGRGANFLCNLTQAMLTTASWGALIGVKLMTGYDNISAFFGKGKRKAVQLLQPMEGTSELWGVSRERVISIQFNENFKFKIRKPGPCVNCTERSGIVWMCLLRDLSQA